MDESESKKVMVFEILKYAFGDVAGARLGRLAMPQRNTVKTPNFFGLTSRGAIPHLTPDIVQEHVPVGGVYLALEDFVEKSNKTTPPLISLSNHVPKPLHTFTALPTPMITLLSPRRQSPVRAPMGNGYKYVSIFTSTGFQSLHNTTYLSSLTSIRPDIAVPLADIPGSGSPDRVLPVAKRQMRMAERTEDWMAELIDELDPETLEKEMKTGILAPVLPLSHPMQWEYLSRLAEEEWVRRLSGLNLVDTDIIPELISQYPTLNHLPRFYTGPVLTPHHILQQISLGIDIFTIPFLNTVSDAGVAMTFEFPGPSSSSQQRNLPDDNNDNANNPDNPDDTNGTPNLLPLGTNMWNTAHADSLAPLSPNCLCYTCTNHHRGFIHHLLQAREMLSWSLLQIHNYHVMHSFFSAIRETLAASATATTINDTASSTTATTTTDAPAAATTLDTPPPYPSSPLWEQSCAKFTKTYAPNFPAGTGDRPRARGYQFKSAGHDEKINKKPWDKESFEIEVEGVAEPESSAQGAEVRGKGQVDGTAGEGNSSEEVGAAVEKGISGLNLRSETETPLVPDESMDASDLDERGIGFAETIKKP